MSISKAVADRLDRVLRKLESALGVNGLTGASLTIAPANPGYMDTDTFTVTILAGAPGAGLSSAIVVPTPAPRGWAVELPNAWTAANIGFDGSDDGTNWTPLRDQYGARVKITGVATNAVATYIAPPECWTLGAYAQVRLASIDTADSTAENQAGDRVLKVKVFA